MIEKWKDILGYENMYQVSNFGRVRSLDRVLIRNDGRKYKYVGKLLKVNICKTNGSYLVHLYNNTEGRIAFYVHRLVALSFIPNTENKPEVNHIDGNRNNNHVSNLEWTTRQENMDHGFRTGLINNTGINHGNNIYTDNQIKDVKLLLKNTEMTQKEIAEVTGVKKGTVEAIAQGKQWRHINV